MNEKINNKEAILLILDQNRGRHISGTDLAHKLGVSRNSVWKSIKTLQDEGYAIEAITNKGYCLLQENDIVSVQSIRKYLKESTIPLNLEVYKTVDSTNNKVKEYAMAGKPEGMVVIAEEQTQGRGRMNRPFYSPETTGIYLSILLRPQISATESLAITTAAAVAVARAIEMVSNLDAKIKWVNDVYCSEKKVCGILTEASLNVETGMLDYAVLGIGINVRQPKGGFPDELKNIATAIFDGTSDSVDARSKLAAEIINCFMEYYNELSSKAFMPEYKRRSFLLGQRIRTLTEPEIHGIAIDIDDDARLIVRLEDGSVKALSSGEVSVRLQ